MIHERIMSECFAPNWEYDDKLFRRGISRVLALADYWRAEVYNSHMALMAEPGRHPVRYASPDHAQVIMTLLPMATLDMVLEVIDRISRNSQNRLDLELLLAERGKVLLGVREICQQEFHQKRGWQSIVMMCFTRSHEHGTKEMTFLRQCLNLLKSLLNESRA